VAAARQAAAGAADGEVSSDAITARDADDARPSAVACSFDPRLTLLNTSRFQVAGEAGMTTQFQAVLFFVFIGFFILIGLVSLAALLGLVKSADPNFKRWAVPGFVGAVTATVITFFKSLPTIAPIIVTLVAPSGALAPSPLKSGTYEYDQVTSDKVKVVTHTGQLIPVLGEGGSWQVQLPGEVATNPTRLHLEDENGGWWLVGPFFPNYIRQEMRTGKPFTAAPQASWTAPGVAVVAAAEPASAQQQAGVKFNNYARKTGDQYGRPYYEWRVFVDEPSPVLQTIEQVDYALHPTFSDPFRTSRNRDNAFELVTSGWGEFTIVITVHFTNGKEAKTGYYLNLSKPWPAEPQKRTTSTSNLQIQLEKVHVEWDGSGGASTWGFDVLLDGKSVLQLPNRSYTDRKGGTSDYVPDTMHRAIGSVKLSAGQLARLEVRGKRSFGGDTAAGTANVDAKAGPITVVARNRQDPKKGSFVFSFSAAPQ
jgi:hypothetical protein